ncbi:Uncharacterised protein [Mycobacterium tuberculosis]|nr:Uncharacterised protein [Mycobacterium tuberculosis]
MVVTQLPQRLTLAVQTSSHGLVRVVEHQWNFLKVRFFQDLQP